MNIKGTYPGALLVFPDSPVVTGWQRLLVYNDQDIAPDFGGDGSWVEGPAVVVASFAYDDDEYLNLLYAITATGINWVKVDRRKKVVDHVA